MDNDSARPAGDRFPQRLVLVLSAVVVGAHFLGVFLPNGNFWGADAYSYYSSGVVMLATLALTAVALLVSITWTRRRKASTHPLPVAAPRQMGDFWVYPALAVGGAGLFGWFRAAHVFLGDGLVMVSTLPLEKRFHPFEPLAMFLEEITYDAAAPLLTEPGREPFEVAWIGAAMLSVLAGAVFVPVAWALARRLTRRLPGVLAAGGNGLLFTTIVFSVLVTQGYVQLFFGYVEIYALSAAAIAVFILTSLRFLDDEAPLWPAAVALAVAIALHLSALVLVPSFALLVALAIVDPARRPRLARDVVFSGLVFAALPLSLAFLGSGYNLGSTVISLVSGLLTHQPEPIPHYFLSWRHLRDIVNEQILIGPLAMGLFVPLAVSAMCRKWWGIRGAGYFIALGMGFVIVCLLAGDSNLGYARNWDLLAPAGVALTVAGLGLLLPRLHDSPAARACLLLALAVSLYHTVPWIGVNASFPRALDRFASLPLQLGRAQSTVGYWYALKGNHGEAERWFVRALDEFPNNIRAHVYLGDLYSHRGDHRRAGLAYRAAVILNPDSDEYRLRLVDALVRAGTPAEALPEVERVLRHQPRNPRIWTVYGIVLLGTGRTAAARGAFTNAQRNAPANLIYRLMVNYADLPRGFERALVDVWGVLVRA